MRSKLSAGRRARRAVLGCALVSTLLATSCGQTAAQEAPGTFGFVAKVDAEGILNPRLKAVLIQSVVPGLPAAAAGISAGDVVLEVEGHPVAGAAASEMSRLMKRTPGQKLVLKLKRAAGETYVVELNAVPRP